MFWIGAVIAVFAFLILILLRFDPVWAMAFSAVAGGFVVLVIRDALSGSGSGGSDGGSDSSGDSSDGGGDGGGD